MKPTDPFIVQPKSDAELLDKVSPNQPGADPKLDNSAKDMLKDKPKENFNKRRSPIKWFKDLERKQKIIFVVVVLLILGGGGYGVYAAFFKPKPKPVVKQEAPKEAPKPTKFASPLTGVMLDDEALTKRPVTGIMIENSPDARPQSGLRDSGVIFEAIAEGGITRFLTLHQEDKPDYIGPVRSVRPYYVDWVKAFDAGLVHAGGSNDGITRLSSEGVLDLDYSNGAYFMRVNTRAAPHNLYTTMDKLDALNKSKGKTSSNFKGFPRKDEKAVATPTAKSIDFSISAPLYSPHYDYDATTNTYKRSEGGAPHKDLKSGTQLEPKVVIAIVMNFTIIDKVGHGGYNTVGSGICFVFQDGGVTKGTWSKSATSSQIEFKDTSGTAIALDRGQTWISAVNNEPAVKYTP